MSGGDVLSPNSLSQSKFFTETVQESTQPMESVERGAATPRGVRHATRPCIRLLRQFGYPKLRQSQVGANQIVCHQPEPAYENVIGGGPVGGGVGRLTLSRYGGVVPAAHTSVRKSHHHQGGTTTLYTLGSASTSQRHHPAYLGASTPLIELTTGSRGSTTSPEVANIYDVIEEKSSRGGRGNSRGGTLQSPSGSQGLPGGFHHNNHHRPLTPGSVKTCGSETGVYACGGHCLPFERVCDKILRVVYGIGVLVGIGLLLAGMNGHQLRQHQNTLMYIGLMVFCVCCLLLWIQCRHYANRRRHRRHTTASRHRAPPTLPSPTMIPMTDFNGGVPYHPAGYITQGAGQTGHTPLILSHENPLLHRYIEQQSTYTPPPPPVSELETHASSLYAQA
ncbi:hypothetical protein M8J75_015844 [Diaphorina citri]|nr:hypothetical protein M8J75_015844 [Diaphorina citri]